MTSAPPPVPGAPPGGAEDADSIAALRSSATKPGSGGQDDAREVSEQHLDDGGAKLARVAEPRERQAVDVKPMYFVLGVGLFGAAFAMYLVYLALEASGAL